MYAKGGQQNQAAAAGKEQSVTTRRQSSGSVRMGRWAALGAMIGGIIGGILTLPGMWQGSLVAMKYFGLALLVGVAAGIAVGSIYARGGLKWFWGLVVALGAGLFTVALATRDMRTSGTMLMLAGGALAVAFGLWVLLAAALHAWRTRH